MAPFTRSGVGCGSTAATSTRFSTSSSATVSSGACATSKTAAANVVALTPRGTTALKRLDKRVDAAQNALLEPLSAADRRELRRLLGRLVDGA
jgi:hypothetical protein